MQNSRWSDPHVLMAAFSTGNTQAFQHIYHLHQQSLFILASRLIDNTSEAEDIVAEVFVKLWEKRDTIETISHIRPWLIRVTTNLAIDRLKTNKRKEMSEKEILYLSDKAENEDYLQAQVIKSELLDKTLALMDDMPDSMRQIFKMIFIDGLKNADIAKRLNISMDTVRVQKGRALKMLKSAFHLNDPPEDPDE